MDKHVQYIILIPIPLAKCLKHERAIKDNIKEFIAK